MACTTLKIILPPTGKAGRGRLGGGESTVNSNGECSIALSLIAFNKNIRQAAWVGELEGTGPPEVPQFDSGRLKSLTDGGVGQQFKLGLSGVPQPGPDGIQAAVSTEHRGSFIASPGAQFYWPAPAGPGRTKAEYQTDAMADARS